MPIRKNILRKGKAPKQNLRSFDVFREETGVLGDLTTSQYFNISEFPSVLPTGNSSFLIEGSNLLKPNVELKTELLDAQGNPIFHYAIPYYNNELPARRIAIEIYTDDVVNGVGSFTVLGELDPRTTNVPTQFQDTYNVRFTAPITINKRIKNTQPIRFYGDPTITVSELVKGVITTETSTGQINETITGSVQVDVTETITEATAPNNPFVGTSDNFNSVGNNTKKYFAKNFTESQPAIIEEPTIITTKDTRFTYVVKEMEKGTENDLNKITSAMGGATITFNNPHQLVDSTLYPDSKWTKPTTFETTIIEVINSTSFKTSENYFITSKTNNNKVYVGLNASSNNVSITHKVQSVGEVENTVFKRSYANITVGNLQTFSGDTYKAKIYMKEDGSAGSFEPIYETLVASPNELIDVNSISGFKSVGVFNSQSIVDNYWVTSSNLSSATQNDDTIINGVLLSGSNAAYGSSYDFKINDIYSLQKNETYVVSFGVAFKPTDKTQSNGTSKREAKLEVFLTGSFVSTQDQELKLGEVDLTKYDFETINDYTKVKQLQIIDFQTHNESSLPSGSLGFRVHSGEFILNDVRLKPFSEQNFSPGFFKANVPMPKPIKRGQNYDFYVEFFDANNNKAEAVAIADNVSFQGPPQVLADGLDATFSGSMTIGESMEMYGVNPAYLRSIGYQGFQHAIDNDLGGFLIFSGSINSRISASESGSSFIYDGVGLEVVDGGGDVDRYLRFRTKPSIFEVATDTFFLGREGQFISGSNGNIAISSSNFFLGDSNGAFISGSNSNLEISSDNFSVDVNGNVTMSGYVSASGGYIGNFEIVDGKISGSNITMDANNSTIFKTDQGPGSDPQAPGFESQADEYYIDFTPTEESPDNYYIKMGPNFMVDKDGILIASGATFIGTITASAGLIGGFTVGSASLFNGSEATPKFFFSGSATGNDFDKENLFISASGFQVNSQGAMSASSGQIGGFNIDRTTLSSTSGELVITGSTGQITGSSVLFDGGKIGGFDLDTISIASSNNNLILSSSGQITGSTVFFDGGKIGGFELDTISIASSNDNLILSSSGQITGSTVLFDGGKIGGWTLSDTTISSNNLVLSSEGQISSQGYASNQQGFFLGMRPLADGSVGAYLEVDEAQIRGTLKTTVFEKESVNAVGGQLHIANSTTITGSVSMSATDTIMQVANASGFSTGEIIQLKKFNATGFTTEYMKIHSVSRQEPSSDINFSGSLEVTRSLGTSALPGTISGSIGFSGSSAQSYTPGQVLVSTGKVGTGYIRLNANPNDQTTPYMDIVERTGSGVYDVQLKARLGDLSGVSDTINGQAVSGFGLYTDNAFLKGGIVATYGAIGGWSIDNNSIFTGTKDVSGYTGGAGSITITSAGGIHTPNFYVDSSGNAAIRGAITIESGDLAGVTVNSISGSSKSGSDSATATGEQGISDAATAQSGSDSVTSDMADTRKQVVLTSDGIDILNQATNTLVSSFGTDIHLNKGTLYVGVTGSTAPYAELSSNKFQIRNNTRTYLSASTAGFYTSGSVNASEGIIGGWTIGSSTLTGGNATLNSSGDLTLGTSNDVVRLSATDGTYRIWAGNATAGSAPFRVTKGGVLTATGANISGTITITNFESTYGSLISGSITGQTGSLDTAIATAQSGSDSATVTGNQGISDAATAQSASNSATVTGEQGISNAATAQAAIDTMETQVVLNSGGMDLRKSNGTTNVVSYGTTTKFFDGVSDAAANVKLQLQAAGIQLYGDTIYQKATLDSSGLTIYDDRSSVATNVANFGSTLRIGENSSTKSALRVDGSGNLTIGTNSTSNISMTNTGVVTIAGGLNATHVKATSGSIAGWTIDTNTIEKLSGDAGITLDASNNRIIISGSNVAAGGTSGNSVRLFGNSGVIEVSQSGEGVFDTGRTKTFTTEYIVKTDSSRDAINFIKGIDSETELPHTITRTTTNQAAPKLLNVEVENSVDAGIVKTDKLFVTSPTGDNGTNIYMNSERNITTLNYNGATNPTASYYFGNNVDYSFSEVSNANLHPGFHYHYHVSNSVFVGAEQPIGFVQGGAASGSSIFTISTAMVSTEDDDFADAKFNILALDANTSGLGAARQNEYTFLQARHSGSIRVQIQHDGDIVSKGNITGFASSFLTVSDEREKKDIYQISESLDRILELRPTKFTWIETNKEDVGFIAQEVEKVIPEVVETTRGFINTGDDKERKTISYPKLIPYLVDTIKTLTQRIEELEKKVK